MKAREIRALARESLKGKWGKAFGLTIVYFFITFALSILIEKNIPKGILT